MLIAHLSDPHLRTGPLAGEPAAGLHQALGRILALEPLPDCVVVTGDLCEYGHPGAYRDLRSMLERYPLPIHLVIGNHDDRDELIATFGGTPFLGGSTTSRYTVEYPQVTIIALDSKRADSPAGLLGTDQLAWLHETLTHRPSVPAFVCLHHPPLPVGIPFLDGIRLIDGPAFANVIAQHSHVARILAGHVHRVICAPFAGSMLAIAPSTYRQSALRMHDEQPPGYLAEPTGYLLHVLTESGCVTHSAAASHASGVLGGF